MQFIKGERRKYKGKYYKFHARNANYLLHLDTHFIGIIKKRPKNGL